MHSPSPLVLPLSLASLVLGILLGTWTEPAPLPLLGAGAGLALFGLIRLLAARKRPGLAPGALTPLVALALVGAGAASTASTPPFGPDELADGRPRLLDGVIVESSNPAGPGPLTLTLDLRSFMALQGTHRAYGRVQLVVAAPPPTPLVVGDRVVFRASLSRARLTGLPGADPPWRRLASRGVSLLARSRGATTLQRLAGPPGDGERTLPVRWRETVAATLQSVGDTPPATVFHALTLGDSKVIAPALRQGMSVAGISHLIAVSGLNVGLVAAALTAALCALLGRFRALAEHGRQRALAAVGAGTVVTLFCLLWGAQPSAMRALLMSGVGLCAFASGRRPLTRRSLVLSGLALFLVKPLWVFDLGAQLSFVATAGLLFAMPRSATRPTTTWTRLCQATRTVLLTSLVASIATAPLCIHGFGRVSLAGPITNLIAVPLTSIILVPLGLVVATLAPCWPWAAEGLTHVGAWLSTPLVWIGEAFTTLPAAAPRIADPGWPAVLCLYVVMVALVARRTRLVAASIALVIVAMAWPVGPQGTNTQDRLTLHFLDLGGAAATLVDAPGGERLLVDAGSGGIGPASADRLARALRALGASSLDLVVLTAPARDRAGAMASVLDRVRVSRFASTGSEARWAVDVESIRSARAIPTLVVVDPTRLEFTQGFEIQIDPAADRASEPLAVTLRWRGRSLRLGRANAASEELPDWLFLPRGPSRQSAAQQARLITLGSMAGALTGLAPTPIPRGGYVRLSTAGVDWEMHAGNPP